MGRKLTDEEYKQKLKETNPEYESLAPYQGNKIKIPHRHIKCGYIWNIVPGIFFSKMSGCPKCNQSKGESRIETYLQKNKISYISQMKYEDLRGDRNIPLSYDFYLKDFNILIEYQGQQHKYSVDWFGGEEKFKRQQEIDTMKKNYAEEHNIKLLEIWYYDFNNIENILESRLLKQSA